MKKGTILIVIYLVFFGLFLIFNDLSEKNDQTTHYNNHCDSIGADSYKVVPHSNGVYKVKVCMFGEKEKEIEETTFTYHDKRKENTLLRLCVFLLISFSYFMFLYVQESESK